jgi:VanZ family protein
VRRLIDDGARTVWQQRLVKWTHYLGAYLFLPAVALVTWGELDPKPALMEQEIWDKSLHFMAYFGLAGMICLALNGKRRVLAATLALALFGAVLEVLQGITGRDPSLYDELANILGAITGAATGWLILWLLRPKVLAATDAS